MTKLNIGDRVTLLASGDNSTPGTVVDITRGRVAVEFDDLGTSRWVLRPGSLQKVTFNEKPKEKDHAEENIARQ